MHIGVLFFVHWPEFKSDTAATVTSLDVQVSRLNQSPVQTQNAEAINPAPVSKHPIEGSQQPATNNDISTLSESEIKTANAELIEPEVKQAATQPESQTSEETENNTDTEAGPEFSRPVTNETETTVPQTSMVRNESSVPSDSTSVLFNHGDYVAARFAGEAPVVIKPMEAKRKRLKGRVILRGSVNEIGEITNLFIYQSSGQQILDEAALTQAKNWQFEAADVDGVKVKSNVEIPVVFQ
jgi:TonB family protein